MSPNHFNSERVMKNLITEDSNKQNTTSSESKIYVQRLISPSQGGKKKLNRRNTYMLSAEVMEKNRM